MSQNESEVPETAESRLQQVVLMVEDVVREIEVHRSEIRAQLQLVSTLTERAPLIKELQDLDPIRKTLKNCIIRGGGSVPPEVSEPAKPIAPLAIGRFVSQACVSFEELERLHNESIKPSYLPRTTSGGLNADGTLQRALVMHFIFLLARLHRICSAASAIPAIIPGEAIQKFVSAIEPIVQVRHLNEHGHDPDRWSDFNARLARYSLPLFGEIDLVYDEESFRWDKTGPWMGSVLLQPIYEATKEFEKVAGYVAILMKSRSSGDSKQE